MKRHYLHLILLAFSVNTACKKDKMHLFPANDPRLVWQGRTWVDTVSYTHLRAHETVLDLVCRLLLEKKKHK